MQSEVVRLDDSWLGWLPDAIHPKMELRKWSPFSSLKEPSKIISSNTSAPRIKSIGFSHWNEDVLAQLFSFAASL